MRAPLILLAALLVASIMVWRHHSAAELGIRIGVLHSLSGVMAPSEKPLVDALQLAIEEANAMGGINGRKIEAVVVDCRSDPAYCAQQAERLITEEHVQALFGCWTSACRKAVKPIVEKHRHLLFYALRYEGMEQSPNILYGGAVPNQLVMPAVHWALDNLGKNSKREKGGRRGKRVYLAGSDYVFSRVVNILIKDLLAAHGAVVVGEHYLPLGHTDMADLAADILDQQPDMVLNTISGIDNAPFFQSLTNSGIVPDEIPVLSFSVTEVGLAAHDKVLMAGHYVVRNYFQSIQSPENQAFVNRFQDRYGQQAVVDSPMEASYINMLMWINSALEAGSGDLAQVQRTILRQSLPAPEGMVSVDEVTRHLWKVARIGKTLTNGQISTVWDSGRPLEPVPFPTYRSRGEWDQLLTESLSKPQSLAMRDAMVTLRDGMREPRGREW
ncbi:MAG: ABC transporter substrate-binding protein [Nitrosospira sp.]